MKKKKAVVGRVKGTPKKVTNQRKSAVVKLSRGAKKVSPSKPAPRITPKKVAKKVNAGLESGKSSPLDGEHRPVTEAVTPAKETVGVLPTRAPVRKVIRDGKAVPMESSRVVNVEALKEDLAGAIRRFNGTEGGSSVKSRDLSDFWVTEGAPLPAALNKGCGVIGTYSAEELYTQCGGDESCVRALIESLHRVASAAIEAPSEAEQRRVLRAPIAVAPSWSSVRPYYPAVTRAFLGLVEWQCKLASAWPFAFARFMSKIPQNLGSDEFVALVGCVDRPRAEVASSFGWDEMQTAALVERGREQILALFESECPDVQRQWNHALRGTGVVVDHLVQRYVVDSLNREFQTLLGRILAQAMIGAQEDAQGAARWDTSAVA